MFPSASAYVRFELGCARMRIASSHSSSVVDVIMKHTLDLPPQIGDAGGLEVIATWLLEKTPEKFAGTDLDLARTEAAREGLCERVEALPSRLDSTLAVALEDVDRDADLDLVVGNEGQIIALTQKFTEETEQRGRRSHVFPVGIGSSPNRHLIEGIADQGLRLTLSAFVIQTLTS